MDTGIIPSLRAFPFVFSSSYLEKDSKALWFFHGYFFVEHSSVCNGQVKWIHFVCLEEGGKVCNASLFLGKTIPLLLPWKILLLFDKLAEGVMLCFPGAGSAAGAQLLSIPLPSLCSAMRQWELIFSCCFKCWLFSVAEGYPWLLAPCFHFEQRGVLRQGGRSMVPCS